VAASMTCVPSPSAALRRASIRTPLSPIQAASRARHAAVAEDTDRGSQIRRSAGLLGHVRSSASGVVGSSLSKMPAPRSRRYAQAQTVLPPVRLSLRASLL
jgi:hypothetical protein